MSTLQVASRLVELNLQIRAEFRGPLPSSGVQPQETDSEEDISRPVKNSGPFAAPAATQLPPQLQPSSESLAPPVPAASVEAPKRAEALSHCGFVPSCRVSRRQAPQGSTRTSSGLDGSHGDMLRSFFHSATSIKIEQPCLQIILKVCETCWC